jgi:hypothetical protein
MMSSNIANAGAAEEEEEWHPRDPASTTSQLLAGIWHQISEATGMNRGETYSVLYPQMQTQINTPSYMQRLFAHLDHCKDVCDHFGISVTLVPLVDPKTKQTVGFTSKSFRNPKDSRNGDESDEDMQFPYDPMWDDGTDYDNLYKGIDDEYEGPSSLQGREGGGAAAGAAGMTAGLLPPPNTSTPDDDDEMIRVTKEWVGRLMSDMGICPFTQGPDRAGLPVGNVFYRVDRRGDRVEDAYAQFWREASRLENVPERDLSTTLLIVPNLFPTNVEMYENFSNTLTQALSGLQVEELLQLVFFHPHWSFRDGMDRSGSGTSAAANYARRSPWPMINLLRTNQVRAAQRGIPTGAVYSQNAKALGQVGVARLEEMLRRRDWSPLEDHKVNRKELDALRIARDFQETGVVSANDISLVGDTAPAANRVNRNQVEQGDLVTVLLQALDKRLGRGSTSMGGTAAQAGVSSSSFSDSPPPRPLTGPETSASAMAADFLIQQLDKIASQTPVQSLPLEKEGVGGPLPPATSPQEAARQARMEAARKALLEDFEDPDGGAGPTGRGQDETTDVLFGKGGIPDRPDEQFNKGLDPSSFY